MQMQWLVNQIMLLQSVDKHYLIVVQHLSLQGGVNNVEELFNCKKAQIL